MFRSEALARQQYRAPLSGAERGQLFVHAQRGGEEGVGSAHAGTSLESASPYRSATTAKPRRLSSNSTGTETGERGDSMLGRRSRSGLLLTQALRMQLQERSMFRSEALARQQYRAPLSGAERGRLYRPRAARGRGGSGVSARGYISLRARLPIGRRPQPHPEGCRRTQPAQKPASQPSPSGSRPRRSASRGAADPGQQEPGRPVAE